MLCQGNELLLQFGTNIVANEKISGVAADLVRQLGTDPISEQKKHKLMEQMQPRTTYEDVFDRCRFIKASNLRELFLEFLKAKCEINRIYMFDELKPAIYENDKVDRDLSNILIEHIHACSRN